MSIDIHIGLPTLRPRPDPIDVLSGLMEYGGVTTKKKMEPGPVCI